MSTNFYAGSRDGPHLGKRWGSGPGEVSFILQLGPTGILGNASRETLAGVIIGALIEAGVRVVDSAGETYTLEEFASILQGASSISTDYWAFS